MRNHLNSSLVIALIAALIGLASAPAMAQSFGRIELTIVDATGEPVQGATVTATCEELTKFEQVKTTNKKGKAIISVVDATKVYFFKVEHEGYPTVSRSFKPTLGDTTRVTVELTVETTEGGGEVSFTAAEAAFNEGADALRESQFDQARTKFQEALTLDPELSPAYSALAAVEFGVGNYEQAVSAAESFIAAAGPDANAYRIIYDSYVALGDDTKSDAALGELRTLLEEGKPDEVAALLYNDGVEALRRGDDRGAEASFKEALSVKSDLHPASKALAVLYARQDQWADAVEAAEEYLAAVPGDDACLRIRWEGYRQLGDEAGAAEAMKDLAKADPRTLAQEFYEAGLEFFNGGDIDRAMVEFERAIDIDPSLPQAHYQLGLCYLNQGDNAAAKQHIGHFIELAPADHPELGPAKEMLSYLE